MAKPIKPRRYQEPRQHPEPSWRVMVTLRGDDAAAVRQVVVDLNITPGGAARHLIRLGADLPPLLPPDSPN